MKVEVLEIAGINEALYGLGLSFGATSDVEYNEFKPGMYQGLMSFNKGDIVSRMYNRADKLAHKGLGESKFLESIQVWLKITGNRFFWSECDTYRLATKQSDSTMHTLLKENDISTRLKLSTRLGDESDLTAEQRGELISIEFDLEKYYEDYEHILNRVKSSTLPNSFKLQIAKHGLPEAWEQVRVVNTSYKTLQNIYAQRKNHKLHQWQSFCNELKKLPNSKWITGE